MKVSIPLASMNNGALRDLGLTGQDLASVRSVLDEITKLMDAAARTGVRVRVTVLRESGPNFVVDANGMSVDGVNRTVINNFLSKSIIVEQ